MNDTSSRAHTVILADGTFPIHEIPIGYLKNASKIICCDGSTEGLVLAGFEPYAIVGDLDSLTDELATRFADRVYLDENQDTNDLTKAVTWCTEMGMDDIIIVGATGKREDHTIGNISLLAEYAVNLNVMMVTDTGIFRPLLGSCSIESYPGQQISIFSIDTDTEITSSGLRYPLNKTRLLNWWQATLNEALGNQFSLSFEGRLIVYLNF